MEPQGLTQHFLIEGKYLGQALRPPGSPSLGFFCYECGEVWARAPVDGPPTTCPTKWHYLASLCRRCGARHQYTLTVPGSLYFLYPDAGFPAAFPDAVLQWEVQRHFEQLDKLKAIQS